MDAFISYNGLPIGSGGGHGLGQLKPIEAYHLTTKFLQKFGDNSFATCIRIEQYRAEKNEFDSSKIHWEMRGKFGWFPRREVWRFPDGKQRLWYWNITNRNKDEALKYLNTLEHLPRHEFGPINMRLSWQFKLKDPSTNNVLPNQSSIPTIDFRLPNNCVRLTLSHKSSLAIYIAFPFSDPEDEEFRVYVNEMKEDAPFKFSQKHWRLWVKSKNGNWNPKKIEI